MTITYSYSDGAPTYTCGNGGYEFTRTWTATAEDDCGNESSTSCALIIVEDNIAPEASITCPADIAVSLDENCEADLSTTPSAWPRSGTDNCDSDVDIAISYEDESPTYTCTGDDDQLDGSYSFVRTFTATATDDCGNTHSTSCDRAITVNDETAPTQIFPNLATDTLTSTWIATPTPRRRPSRSGDERQLRQRCGCCGDLRGQYSQLRFPLR